MNQPELLFDGPGLLATDQPRLCRQLGKVADLMSDHCWRTLREISEQTFEPEASISARLRDLRKPKFGGLTVQRRRRGGDASGLFEYRVTTDETDKT